MVRTVICTLGLCALWYLMSGLQKPLVLVLGGASAVFATFVLWRMERLDGHRLGYSLNPFRVLGYLVWLLVEIAKSNIAVTRVVLSGGKDIRQHLFRVPNTQKTEVGATVF
ncbi:MAG: Na+/H+ antiporter subunit E, partial [Pseudomonadota bacterium]